MKKIEAKISILMPMKNASKFLEDCLDSVINQSEENWELIIVNDQSTDRSFQIANDYAVRDERISVCKNEGKGIIPALQTAYKKSEGNFVHRMDADDIMPIGKLSALKEILLRHDNKVVATGRVRYFSNHGISEGYEKYQNWLNNLCIDDRHWREIYKECVIASPCWMMRRNDFELCGAFNSTIYPEDYDLVFRIYKSGYKVVASDEILHLWRDHPDRSSRTHEHYQQNSFFNIKLHYFLELDYDQSKPLILWGGGRKGKVMAKLLREKGISFQWVSNNPNKFGRKIYNQLMNSYEAILSANQPQVIVTVAQRNAKEEIIEFFKRNKITVGKDAWFFS